MLRLRWLLYYMYICVVGILKSHICFSKNLLILSALNEVNYLERETVVALSLGSRRRGSYY